MNTRTCYAWALTCALLWQTSSLLAQSGIPSVYQGEGGPAATDPASPAGELTQAGLTLESEAPGSSGVFGGVDLLFIRPHFSEAVAFARGVQTATTIHTEGQPLDFDYEPSFRLYGGLAAPGGDEFRFTFWHYDGDVDVNGTAPPGEFIADPFGNIVGVAVVVDPRDGRFVPPPPAGPGPTVLIGGDRIRTKAEVQTNVVDLEFRQSITATENPLDLDWSAGLRIADIDQFYRSFITAGGAPHTNGQFGVDFTGAGPRIGLEGTRSVVSESFSLYGRTFGSLLVGSYDVQFSNQVFAPVVFTASQEQSMTRTIPVLEAELGAAYRPNSWLALAAGWTFQAWFDMGTSGGNFGGFFTGADDSNIMTFDGFTLTAEIAY